MTETRQLSPQRQQFLLDMGAVVVANFPDYDVDADGVVGGSFGKWIPIEEQEPLDTLFKTMRLAGLDPAEFQFQQYDVIAANPYHANRVDLKFPSQLVIKSVFYTGIHQLDLVLRSPFVTAIEIQSGIRRRQG
jgi:hypothetical protein